MRHRIQVDLDSTAMARVDDMGKKLGRKSRTQVMGVALRLIEWYLKRTKDENCVLCLQDPATGKLIAVDLGL